MGTIGIRDLSRNASRVIDQVSSTGSPMIVTKHGRPVAAVVAVDPDALEDFVLATAPEYAAARRAADADLAAGRTRPAAAVFDQIRRKG
ncbi:MAG: type II toxin-antitoxin system Phd/YefM family antitoxin [Actinobacteria bacterium]|nr:type II toxin-antitoxin system Phd/YefM family antitoxin [Actinomycetota bacterium]